MRALAAVFTVLVGLGAMTALAGTMAACSDTSDAGSGGASGAGTSAGASSGGAGSGGACTFSSNACQSCLSAKCADLLVTCSGDADCKTALGKLTPCACGGTDVDTCAADFYTAGGDPAEKLVECYSLNCTDPCE